MYDMGIKKIKSQPLFPKSIKLDGMPSVKPLKPHQKKDRRYWQTDLMPLGDADKDNKINLLDCYPYDPSRQGIADIKEKFSEVGGKLKEKLGITEEERQLKLMDKEIKNLQKEKKQKDKKAEREKEILERADQIENSKYILVKYFDNPYWINVGAFSVENIDEELYQIEQNPDVESVITTNDYDLLKRLNRKAMLEPIKETAKEAGKYAIKKFAEAGERVTRDMDIAPQASQNVRSGLRANPSAYGDMQRMAQGPSGKPPIRRPNVPSASPSIGSSGSLGSRLNLQALRQAGQRLQQQQGYQSPVEDRPFVDEKPYGYSQRSPNYQEESPFGPSVVPYRPIARRQVTVPNRPAKAPAWGSTIIDLGINRGISGGTSSRPIGMLPMAKFKFVKPVQLRMGIRRE